MSGERFWLLLSDKLGDNAQARVLAAASGLPFAEKRILMRPEYVLGKPRCRPSLHHVDLARSDPLEPPWPDLVLTIGRRCAMAALWIRERSGGRTRIALIGRPRPGPFDLMVVPPQYRVAEGPGIVRLELPLMRADPAKVEEARGRFSHLADLPRPLTAVLVGGATRPFRFGAREARALAADLLTLKAREGGTLYVTTSRRTGEAAAGALEEALGGAAQVYRFRPGAPDNPYLGLLAHADRFVVTGDSVSMMVEVARLGRPLAIRPLPLRRDPLGLADRLLARLRDPARPLGRILSGTVPVSAPRDLAAFWDYLRARGLAVMFGEPFRPPAPVRDADLERAAAELRRLAGVPAHGVVAARAEERS
ncbi:hypothetical protein HRbin39_01377 [bacterium HR39]|nr:hypothetical protein HRbin39_01377 [bacterium HR39]